MFSRWVCFITFSVEGQYKPRATGPAMLAHLRSNVIISVLCSNDL